MKLRDRLISCVLAITFIGTLSSCKKNEDKTVLDSRPSIENTEIENKKDTKLSINTNEKTVTDEVKEDSLSVESILYETLYDENIEYKGIIDDYLNSDSRDEMKNDYLKAVYMLLYNSDVSMEKYLEELHYLVLLQQVPQGLSNEIWLKLFGNLINASSQYPSLYDMFSEFAFYVHDLTCGHTHTLNEFEGFTCDKLNSDYLLVRDKI